MDLGQATLFGEYVVTAGFPDKAIVCDGDGVGATLLSVSSRMETLTVFKVFLIQL